MQRRPALTLTALAAAAAISAVLAIGHGNEMGKAEATIGGAKVTIAYGRPTLKGRDLAKLIAPGQMWRMGADVPTTIESDADLDFGGTRVPKGKHVLLARLDAPGQWTLVVSSQPVSHFAASAKLAEAPMKVEEPGSPVEQLTISLASDGSNGGTIEIAWGSQRLIAAFKPAS